MFEPELVRYALESESMNLGHLIFGGHLWATLHASAQLPPACLSSNNSLTDFFTTASMHLRSLFLLPLTLSASPLEHERLLAG